MNKKQKVETLYNTYRDIMFREAFGVLEDEMLAEDAVSETFLRIIKSLDRIKLDESIHTRNFLVLVCRNVARDIYRKIKREDKLYDKLEENIVFPETLEDIVIDRDSVNKIVGIISKMDPIYKDVMLLSKIYNVSRSDIAQMLGITEETVTKRLQRAKAIIKEKLRKEER